MTETKENIFLFVPNLIGFARIFLALISFYFMRTNCLVAASCYITSAFLDVFDGYAARYLNQSTKFGAMLDQLTDRAGTACLMMALATFYPEYTFWLQISMAIDITCHWFYLHSTVVQGKASHKLIDMSAHPLMRLYYTNRTVLFFMCAGNEAFYASLYVMHFYPVTPTVLGIGLFRLVMWLSLPVAVLKAGISLLHGAVAALNVASIDLQERAKAQ